MAEYPANIKELCHQLRHQLLTENAHLRAENERLTGERDRQYDFATGQIAKVAALEAENERLREALSKAYAQADLAAEAINDDERAKRMATAFRIIAETTGVALAAARKEGE